MDLYVCHTVGTPSMPNTAQAVCIPIFQSMAHTLSLAIPMLVYRATQSSTTAHVMAPVPNVVFSWRRISGGLPLFVFFGVELGIGADTALAPQVFTTAKVGGVSRRPVRIAPYVEYNRLPNALPGPIGGTHVTISRAGCGWQLRICSVLCQYQTYPLPTRYAPVGACQNCV